MLLGYAQNYYFHLREYMYLLSEYETHADYLQVITRTMPTRGERKRKRGGIDMREWSHMYINTINKL
jgi:hypothetical protein